MPRKRVLFLCTGNACRSQMAEGWTRHLLGDAIDARSAGVEAYGLDPRAVAVMAEAGVDISAQASRLVTDVLEFAPDLVVTVCDHAAARCPTFPGDGRRLHHAFRDPAAATGTEEEILRVFRAVRDEIRTFVTSLPERLAAGPR